jgi:hypothetical protein
VPRAMDQRARKADSQARSRSSTDSRIPTPTGPSTVPNPIPRPSRRANRDGANPRRGRPSRHRARTSLGWRVHPRLNWSVRHRPNVHRRPSVRRQKILRRMHRRAAVSRRARWPQAWFRIQPNTSSRRSPAGASRIESGPHSPWFRQQQGTPSSRPGHIDLTRSIRSEGVAEYLWLTSCLTGGWGGPALRACTSVCRIQGERPRRGPATPPNRHPRADVRDQVCGPRADSQIGASCSCDLPNNADRAGVALD